MHPTRSLRFRVAVAFACFGAFLSLLLAAGIYLTAHDLGRRLMDETLRAEMDDYTARLRRNPLARPQDTATIKGYIAPASGSEPRMPAAVASLPDGHHTLVLRGVYYRTLVEEHDGKRFYMLFNEAAQRRREEMFVWGLAAAVVIITLLSAGGGFWLAVRVVSPLTRLADQVARAEPDSLDLSLSEQARHDEVGELARAFDRYLQRLRAFIERERNFTADVSHELRTPLAIIRGAVEVLEEDPSLGDRRKQKIDRIARAAQDMSDLSAALLALAREQTRSVEEQHCDVDQVVRECVDKHRYLIAGKPVEVDMSFADKRTVTAERTLLAIVIGNLIRNAFSYTEAGRVSIRLEPHRLVVRDTGVGIRTEELGRIFQHYYRGSGSTGAGVGLSLVKRICERFGWDISIESQQGHGTTAELLFTRCDTPAATPAPA